MNRLLLGLAAIGAVAFAASCASDPTGSLGGSPSTVVTTLGFISLNVGDSVRVDAETRDGQGVVLPAAPDATSATPGVVTLNEIEGGPLSQTSFYVKGAGFGEGTVNLSQGGASTAITVQTYPGLVGITGMMDTLGSGSTVQLAPDPQDVLGNSITADTIYEWATSDASVLSIDSTGLVSAAAPGDAEITVTTPAGGDAGGATATISMTVVAGTFGGTLSAASGLGGELVTVTREAGGPEFDADTRVDLGGEDAWVESFTADDIVFAVPMTGTAGAQDLTITNMGPTQIAQIGTFDNTDAANDQFAPGYHGTAGAPDLASVITANGNVYFSHLGGRGIFNGGADVDEYFAVTAGASDLDLDILLRWGNGSDVDIYVCENSLATCPFTYFSGEDDNEAANGITIPAGETWYVIVSMWSEGSGRTNFRMEVTGL